MAAEPEAITQNMLRAHLVGLGDLLEALADFSGLPIAAVTQHRVLAAQYRLAEATSVPFFVTRFCTREIATQDTLAIGTNFDRYVDAQDYVLRDWKANTGRLRTRYAPLIPSAIETVMISLRSSGSNSGEIVTIPDEWIQVKDWKGRIDVIPYGSGALNYTTFYTLVGVLAIQRAATTSGVVPSAIHLRYSAGLAERTYTTGTPPVTTTFDPEGDLANYTEHDHGMLREYQVAIGKLAASSIMTDIAREMDRGGYQVSFDGLSQGVNPNVLLQHAQENERWAMEWASRFKRERRGLTLSWA